MSNYPSSSADDAASISNQPLIPKKAEPKNYEAAAAALMTSYGFSGGMQATPAPSKKKKNAKGKSKKKAGTSGGDNAGGTSNATPSNTSSGK